MTVEESPRLSPADPFAWMLPLVSLAAALGMLLPRPALAAPVWVALMLVLSAVAARRGRGLGLRSGAAEPFAMALMFVAGALHGHSAEVAATPDVLHAGHHGAPWLAGLVAIAAAGLSAVCLAGAVRGIAEVSWVGGLPLRSVRGAPAAVLQLSSALVMCAMTVHLLLM